MMPFGIYRSRGERSTISLADRAREEGKWARAAHLYSQTLQRNPQNPPIWTQYAHSLKEQGYLVQAEDAYRKAIELDPLNSDTYLHLGHVLKLQGEIEKARGAYLLSYIHDPLQRDAVNELMALGWSEQHFSELQLMLQSHIG